MLRTAALARKTAADTASYARAAIVLSCAVALILAGEFLPLSF